jgi:hypothetical protein
MEMGGGMLIEEHANDDAEKTANDRHGEDE